MRTGITHKRQERMVSVAMLFGECGFSISHTAQALGTTESKVSNDVRSLGGKKAFPHRPSDGEKFACAFRRYAELSVQRRWKRLPTKERHLHKATASIINARDIEGFARGVEETMDVLLQPQCSLEEEGCRKLLRAIFGARSGLGFWWPYLENVAEGVTPPPKTREDIEKAGHAYIKTCRPDIMPIWPEGEALKAVEAVLETLTEREQVVIRARFGIGATLATLEKIAEGFGVGNQRIGQIELKALRKLRHPSRSRFLKKFGQSIGDALAQALAQERKDTERATLDTSLKESKSHAGWLRTRVAELDLSMRTANCLSMARIETVADLVEKTELDLLKSKNLGHKSLNEIKKLVSEMGLSLGMNIKDIHPNEQPQ